MASIGAGSMPWLYRHEGVGFVDEHRRETVEQVVRRRDVGIDERHQPCGGGRRAGDAGMRLARPPVGQGRCRDHRRPAPGSHLGRAVGRVVVDHHQLVTGTKLGDEGFEESVDDVRLVTSRHHHRDRWASRTTVGRWQSAGRPQQAPADRPPGREQARGPSARRAGPPLDPRHQHVPSLPCSPSDPWAGFWVPPQTHRRRSASRNGDRWHPEVDGRWARALRSGRRSDEVRHVR